MDSPTSAAPSSPHASLDTARNDDSGTTPKPATAAQKPEATTSRIRSAMTSLVNRLSRFPKTIFFFLAVAVLVLSVDILGMFGAGDPKRPGVVLEASINRAWVAADSSARRFLEQEHQVITSEIQLRLQLEHLLFALKFALVGGTLYLLFQQAFKESSSRFHRNEFTSLISWAAVVAAAIVDLRLATNTAFITTLGSWVRQYEDLRLGHAGVGLGWEAFLADHLLGSTYYPALRFSSQILTALLFCITAAMFFLSPGRPDRQTRFASFIGAVLSVLLMAVAALDLRPTDIAARTIIGGAASIAVLMVVILSFGNREPAEKVQVLSGSSAGEEISATPGPTQVTPPG